MCQIYDAINLETEIKMTKEMPQKYALWKNQTCPLMFEKKVLKAKSKVMCNNDIEDKVVLPRGQKRPLHVK